jgi:hypothetical protein
VLASNAADDDEPDDDVDDMIVDPPPTPKVMTEAEKRAARLAEAKSLRSSAKL